MKMYYVTATHPEAQVRRDVEPKQQHGLEDRERVELAKFFERAVADEFVRRLHRSWMLVQVEEREEAADR